MSIPLNDLLRNIGSSVQDAQNYLEYNAITAYLGYFKNTALSDSKGGEDNADNASGDTMSPITKKIAIPSTVHSDEMQTIEMPLAALSQHCTMKLDTVTVRLSATPTIDPVTNGLLLNVGPACDEANQAADNVASELELVFRSASCAEGIARLNQNNLRHF